MVNKSKIVIVILSLLILLIPYSLAVGVCELSKYEYHPGERASLICSCDNPSQQNRAGFIVFENDNGTILSSVATNSGSCTSSLFGDDYLFLTGSNFTGTATFSSNADGTGTPASWGVPSIITDDFNVSGGHLSDCIIEIEVGDLSMYELGKEASLTIRVADSVTNEKLIRATCQLHVELLNSFDLFKIPSDPGLPGLTSTADGEIIFETLLDNSLLIPDTVYLTKIYCYCTPNGTDEQCYLEGNGVAGSVAGFKTCTLEVLTSSAQDDYRPMIKLQENMLSLIFVFIIIIMFLSGIGIVNLLDSKKLVKTKEGEKEVFDTARWPYWAMYTSFAFAGMEFLIMLGTIYGTFTGLNIILLLKINFWFYLIIAVFLFILTMAMSIVSIMSFREVNDWSERKW